MIDFAPGLIFVGSVALCHLGSTLRFKIAWARRSWRAALFLVLLTSCGSGLLLGFSGYYDSLMVNSPRSYLALKHLFSGVETVTMAVDRRIFISDTEVETMATDEHLGDSFLGSGEFQEAEREFRNALEIDSNNFSARKKIGDIFFQNGSFETALHEYLEATRLRPEDANLRFILGSACVQSSHPALALAAYEEAVRLDPSNAGAHNGLATVLVYFGRFDEAIAQFEEAVRNNPNDPTFAANLAQAEEMRAKPGKK